MSFNLLKHDLYYIYIYIKLRKKDRKYLLGVSKSKIFSLGCSDLDSWGWQSPTGWSAAQTLIL